MDEKNRLRVQNGECDRQDRMARQRNTGRKVVAMLSFPLTVKHVHLTAK